MEKINVAGLYINPVTKQELLTHLKVRLAAGEQTFLTTLYSEFLHAGLSSTSVRDMLNTAGIAVADGIGVLWAATFLAIPLSLKSYYGKIIQALWQVMYTGSSILLKPGFVRRVVPEKIVGAELVWDIARLAQEHNYSVYLLGGFGDTGERAAKKLQKKFPGLRIAGTSNKHPEDSSIVTDIASRAPDILFVAFGPIKQEQWIAEHLTQLPVKLAIGLGGTFDYLAGNVPNPPGLLRSFGLEWLFRLITQPRRIKRIWRGTVGLMYRLTLYKVQATLPYRNNVCCVIFNQAGKVFIGLRKPDGQQRNQNHWMIPQGGLEAGESIEACALREAFEETGMKTLKLLAVSQHTHSYWWPLGFSKKFKGQKQAVAYLQFSGADAEISLDHHTTVEFIEYKWVGVPDLLSQLHPLRRPLGAIVQADFPQIKPLLSNQGL